MNTKAKIITDGENEILIFPPGFGFGVGVDIKMERVGNKLYLSRIDPDLEVSTPVDFDDQGI